MFSSVRDGIANLRKKESPLETQLKEATSRENWGVPNSTLQAIASSTQEMESCDFIMNFLWKVLQEKKEKEWRRIVKALSLIEVILKHGSERAIQDVRREQWRIQQWKEFRHMEDGKDVGSAIRFKVSTILEMLSDEELLQEEKDKAAKISQKMTSMGAPGAEAAGKASLGPSAFKSPFDKARRKKWRRGQAEESPQSSPSGFSPGGGRPPASEAEANAMVQQFISVTNASRLSAKECLERNQWDMHRAVMQYLGGQAGGRDSFGGFGSSFGEKPGWTERKTRADQVVKITQVTEQVAEDLLERAGWNVEAALELYFTEMPSSHAIGRQPSVPSTAARPAARSPSTSSGSEESSSEESEEEAFPKGKGRGGGGFGGGWPQDGSKGGGGWPSGGNGAWGSSGWPGGGGGAGGGGGWQSQPGSNPPSGWGGGGGGGKGGGWPDAGSSGFGGAGPRNDPFAAGGPGAWGGGSAQRSSSNGPSYSSSSFGGPNSGPFGGCGGSSTPRGGQPASNPFGGSCGGSACQGSSGPFGSSSFGGGFGGPASGKGPGGKGAGFGGPAANPFGGSSSGCGGGGCQGKGGGAGFGGPPGGFGGPPGGGYGGPPGGGGGFGGPQGGGFGRPPAGGKGGFGGPPAGGFGGPPGGGGGGGFGSAGFGGQQGGGFGW
eukprot:TRINITY_DN77368_c0_g1_i1.p1 TRINITY_DN77368_c0_g1~~TRINITY_DN77368_c0_g1_i1.p1  ORF type:complete len:674 (-),score=155.62 TRINITY_DN77368_c0_g1_i1:97-2079(-)